MPEQHSAPTPDASPAGDSRHRTTLAEPLHCAPFADLTPPYSTIVADPPWHYDERVIEYGRGAAKSAPMPYSTMTNDEIARLPVMDRGCVR